MKYSGRGVGVESTATPLGVQMSFSVSQYTVLSIEARMQTNGIDDAGYHTKSNMSTLKVVSSTITSRSEGKDVADTDETDGALIQRAIVNIEASLGKDLVALMIGDALDSSPSQPALSPSMSFTSVPMSDSAQTSTSTSTSTSASASASAQNSDSANRLSSSDKLPKKEMIDPDTARKDRWRDEERKGDGERDGEGDARASWAKELFKPSAMAEAVAKQQQEQQQQQQQGRKRDPMLVERAREAGVNIKATNYIIVLRHTCYLEITLKQP